MLLSHQSQRKATHPREMTELNIARPITLACGLTLKNRLAKASMAENLADKKNLPSKSLLEVYSIWADGGWGLVLTGHVPVDATYLGSPYDNALNDRVPVEERLDAWKRWAATTNKNGTPTIVQLNHLGRQCIRGKGSHGFWGNTLAPSAIPIFFGKSLKSKLMSYLLFGVPREMSYNDIQDVVSQFVKAALLSYEAGFAGVQIHAAHGYLLAQFLSGKTNKRNDLYGRSPKNRCRIIVEIIAAIRRVVPKTFCIGVKLNSADHQSEKELAECLEQLEYICCNGVDFLEISGGTYENITCVTGTDTNNNSKAQSTIAREGFFLEFAHAVREKFSHIPLMVTGGFRSRQGMESAVASNACDLIGVARPAVLNPFLPVDIIFNYAICDSDANVPVEIVPRNWVLEQLGVRGFSAVSVLVWYVEQIHKMPKKYLK